MKPRNRLKILPYLLLNFAVAVGFQNCKQSEGTTSAPKAIETDSLEEHQDRSDEHPLREPPTTVGIFPGETEEINLFEPKGIDDPMPLLNLITLDISPELGEVHFGLRGDTYSPHLKNLTCVHTFNSEENSFDCTHLEEFILEGLTEGPHRLTVILTTETDETYKSKPVLFTITLPQR